jgi:hypothetical protein
MIKSETDSYMAPTEGFRWEVTRACMRAIRRNHQCPSCGASVDKPDERRHSEECTELRADIAHDL